MKRLNPASTLEKKTEPHSWSPQMFLRLEGQQPAVPAVGRGAGMQRSCQEPSTCFEESELGSRTSGCGGFMGPARGIVTFFWGEADTLQDAGPSLRCDTSVLTSGGAYWEVMVCGFTCQSSLLPRRRCKIRAWLSQGAPALTAASAGMG